MGVALASSLCNTSLNWDELCTRNIPLPWFIPLGLQIHRSPSATSDKGTEHNTLHTTVHSSPFMWDGEVAVYLPPCTRGQPPQLQPHLCTC